MILGGRRCRPGTPAEYAAVATSQRLRPSAGNDKRRDKREAGFAVSSQEGSAAKPSPVEPGPRRDRRLHQAMLASSAAALGPDISAASGFEANLPQLAATVCNGSCHLLQYEPGLRCARMPSVEREIGVGDDCLPAMVAGPSLATFKPRASSNQNPLTIRPECTEYIARQALPCLARQNCRQLQPVPCFRVSPVHPNSHCRQLPLPLKRSGRAIARSVWCDHNPEAMDRDCAGAGAAQGP